MKFQLTPVAALPLRVAAVQLNPYTTVPPAISVTSAEPLGGLLPAQPSPGSPPVAVHDCAHGTFHERVTGVSALAAELLARSCIGRKPMPSSVSRPVPSGSRTLRSVVPPVVLDASAVEFQTAASAVY